MVHYLTSGTNTTCSLTWVNTFLIHASLIGGTFGCNNTLGSTSWRASHISRDTWTNRLQIRFLTLTIRATRRRVARINVHNCWKKDTACYLIVLQLFGIPTFYHRPTCNECISNVFISTSAHRNVVYHGTFRVLPARVGTRVCTFVSYTGPIFGTICTQYTFGSTTYIRISLVFW